MKCDLSDLESVRKFCKNFVAQETSLHILVNNAGVYQQRKCHQIRLWFHR